MAASTRRISHSGHADPCCIKCNIVAVIRRRRGRPGEIPGHQQLATPRKSSPPGTAYPRPPNPVLHAMQLSPELEPGHKTPAAPPRAPPCREARDELKPPAAFRVMAGRTQPGRSRPGAVGDLDPDDAVPGPDRDRDCLPGSSRAAVPDRITEDLADQQDRVISARVSGAEYLANERAGRHAPAPPALQASRSPGPLPQTLVHPPSRPPSSREIARAARRTHRDGRPTRGQTSS